MWNGYFVPFLAGKNGRTTVIAGMEKGYFKD